LLTDEDFQALQCAMSELYRIDMREPVHRVAMQLCGPFAQMRLIGSPARTSELHLLLHTHALEMQGLLHRWRCDGEALDVAVMLLETEQVVDQLGVMSLGADGGTAPEVENGQTKQSGAKG
jgi:hypothetical protein